MIVHPVSPACAPFLPLIVQVHDIFVVPCRQVREDQQEMGMGIPPHFSVSGSMAGLARGKADADGQGGGWTSPPGSREVGF